jgi:hypothetical protein
MKHAICTKRSFHFRKNWKRSTTTTKRADVCKNKELKSIIEHNRDEEKEHAAMLMEWILRNDPSFSRELKKYLFTE